MEYIMPTSFVGIQAKISVSLAGDRYSLKVDDVVVANVPSIGYILVVKALYLAHIPPESV